jgi:hypothetical protein
MNFDSKSEARVGGVSVDFLRISVKFAAGRWQNRDPCAEIWVLCCKCH